MKRQRCSPLRDQSTRWGRYIDAHRYVVYDGPMEFGLFLQPLHHPSENPTHALERDLALVSLLDELGYAEAWVGEHHSSGWENIAAPDVFIAAAAERTERIRLGTGVLQLGLHHPLVALDRMIFLDHLTKGRTSFGMGVGGGIPSDLAVFGLGPTSAGRRMQESIDAMTRLLSSSRPVTMKTEWFEINEATLQLRPYTEPHMPFAVASSHPDNVRFMGRVGGKVLLGGDPRLVDDVFAELMKGAAEAGVAAHRDQLWLSYVMYLDLDGERARSDFKAGATREFYEFQVGYNGRAEPEHGPDAWYDDYVRRHIIGSPAEATEKIAEIAEESGGIGGMIFMAREWAGDERSRASWRLFADEVMPNFK